MESSLNEPNFKYSLPFFLYWLLTLSHGTHGTICLISYKDAFYLCIHIIFTIYSSNIIMSANIYLTHSTLLLLFIIEPLSHFLNWHVITVINENLCEQ